MCDDMDWKTQCFVCLETKKNEKLCSTFEGWALFSKNIPKLFKYGKVMYKI